MAGTTSPENLEPGRAMLEEALELYRELGDTAGEGNILWGLASYYYFTGDAVSAEGWYRQSLALHRSSGQRTMEAWSLHMLSLSEASQRRFDEARETGRHALRHFFEAGDVSGVTLVLDDLAIVAVASGDPDRGGRLWGAARHLQQTTGTLLADFVDKNMALFGIPRPRDILSPDELAARAAEGAAMSLDEVVAYALGEDGSVPLPHQDLDA
jgi:tetratricopeptide (TPR) repeat protein